MSTAIAGDFGRVRNPLEGLLGWLFGTLGVTLMMSIIVVQAPLPPEMGHSCEATGGATCYYVSPTGTGVGTEGDPGSIEDILPDLSGGDYLYMRGGSYTTSYVGDDYTAIMVADKGFLWPSTTASTPVTIKSYTGETAIIDGGNTVSPCIAVDRQSHVIFEDFTVRNCVNHGFFVGENSPSDDLTFRNLTMYDIKYVDNSGFITINSYDNVTIEDSTFYDYIGRDGDGFVGNYLKFFRASDVTVQNNLMHGDGGGLYYKHGSDSGGTTVISGNTFRDLTRHGVYTNQTDTEITGNLFYGNATFDILVHQEDGSSGTYTYGVDITYNTIVGQGISLNAGNGTLGAYNATVENNIIQDGEYEIFRFGSGSQYTTGVGLTSDNNCFYQTSGSQSIDYFGAGSGGTYTLTQWKAEGFDSTSVEADPDLQGDYTLGGSTNCSGKGHTAAP